MTRKMPLRTMTGLATVVTIVLVFVLSAALFRGSFTRTDELVVLSPRAGLVMDPDAKVKMNGVQIGKVSSIEARPDGMAALHLAMDPAQLPLIPDNVRVDVSSSTVFGAKFVQFLPPPVPSSDALAAGKVLTADRVTVEINTVFEQLTSVLSQVEPAKLNATLSTIASALNGGAGGQKIGRTIDNLDSLLARLEPSLPNLSHDIESAPQVLNTFADVTPDLLTTADRAAQISETVVDKQEDIDTLLLSTIGFADIGNDVVGGNRNALTDALQVLVPTTDLLNEYHESLYCGVGGLLTLSHGFPLKNPGVDVIAGFLWSTERYRYPQDLPKVAAGGGPQCTDLPVVPPGKNPPQVIADIGVNKFRYNNPGIVLNSDGLKQLLFGPIDGPPRNIAQIGQPG